MTLVTPQSNSVGLFDNTSPGKFSNLCSIRKVYLVQEDVNLNQVFHNGNINLTNTLKIVGLVRTNFLKRV